jgi:hypothetical protein
MPLCVRPLWITHEATHAHTHAPGAPETTTAIVPLSVNTSGGDTPSVAPTEPSARGTPKLMLCDGGGADGVARVCKAEVTVCGREPVAVDTIMASMTVAMHTPSFPAAIPLSCMKSRVVAGSHLDVIDQVDDRD